MAIVLIIFKYNFFQYFGDKIFLSAIVLSGFVIYSISFYFFDIEFVHYTLDLVKRMKD
jgi:hypothetical protein